MTGEEKKSLEMSPVVDPAVNHVAGRVYRLLAGVVQVWALSGTESPPVVLWAAVASYSLPQSERRTVGIRIIQARVIDSSGSTGRSDLADRLTDKLHMWY